ncbi:MAG: MarR family winged helix-turn-helix transcriptional regulator [Beijerinckiaceae bacterium]
MANKPLSQSDYEALARFRQALRNFMAFSDSQLEALGLGPQRYQALLAIRAKPDGSRVSVGELADLLLIKPNTAAELANRLEAAGLIERVRDAADRRRALLALTPAGAAKLAEAAQAHIARLQESRSALRMLLGEGEHGLDGENGAAR